MKSFRCLLLALVLLGGQFALLAHATDLDAHADGDVCEICLHVSSLDTGLISSPLAVAASQSFPAYFPAPSVAAPQFTARLFDARGPPSRFSA